MNDKILKILTAVLAVVMVASGVVFFFSSGKDKTEIIK